MYLRQYTRAATPLHSLLPATRLTYQQSCDWAQLNIATTQRTKNTPVLGYLDRIFSFLRLLFLITFFMVTKVSFS